MENNMPENTLVITGAEVNKLTSNFIQFGKTCS